MTARTTMFVLVAMTAGALLILVAHPSCGWGDGGRDGRESKDVEDLRAALAKLQRDHKRLADALAHQAKASPPIGSVTAFAGELPPTEVARKAWEDKIGWLLCDGRTIQGPQYQELRAALGKNSLPDYRGYFLRGIDVAVDGKTTSGRDKKGVRAVGEEQGFATARPAGGSPFTTNTTGNHSHDAGDGFNGLMRSIDADGKKRPHTIKEGDYTPGEPDLISIRAMPVKGDHSHAVTGGGDQETRPVNVAVYWIIKFK